MSRERLENFGNDQENSIKNQMLPGYIELRFQDEGQVIIVYRGKEVDNQRDPDEVVVVLTPESIESLEKITTEKINRRREDSEREDEYSVYDVFGSRVAFRKSMVHESFAHGWTTDFYGPYLVTE